MLYSIIIPCYNSSKTIAKVVNLTTKEMYKLDKKEFEFVLVNDCSPDGGATIMELKRLSENYSNITVVDLAKNSGQHNAVMAGLNYGKGDAFIAMDDDMQTHPSQLGVLFDEFEKGHDVVYGYYPEKKHSFLRNIASKLNSLSVRILVGKPKELKTSSFWVIKRFVRDYVIKYTNQYSYMQGLFLRTTKDITCVPIKHYDREVGSSNYNFKSLIKLWSNVIGFSVMPLRIASTLGYIFSLIGVLGAVIIVIQKMINPAMSLGWPSMMVTICFFSGIILLFMGLIGEYIGRMFLGLSNTPQFVVRELINNKETDNKD